MSASGHFTIGRLAGKATVVDEVEQLLLCLLDEEYTRLDHATNTVLAYMFGKRKDEVFRQLKTLLEPFGINRYYLCPLGTLMAGVFMNAIWRPTNTKQANVTSKK